MAHLGTTLLLGFPAVSTVSTPTPPVATVPRPIVPARARGHIPALVGGHPHTHRPGIALQVSQASPSIAPSVADATHLSNSIQHADDEPARGALGARWAHMGVALCVYRRHTCGFCV